MAHVIALRAMLERLGFSAPAALYITNDQGMNELSEFTLLTNDEVENLCKVVRRPGGTIPNPQRAALQEAGDDIPADMPAHVPKPGIVVPLRAVNNLKLACYFLRFREKTSRDSDPGVVTLPEIRALRNLRDWEKDHEDPTPPEINSKNWPMTIEAIDEYLRGCLGVTSIPLAYIIRDEEEPLPNPDDGFPTKQDALIARAPIRTPPAFDAYHPTYLADRI